jgi:hypothetical protein
MNYLRAQHCSGSVEMLHHVSCTVFLHCIFEKLLKPCAQAPQPVDNAKFDLYLGGSKIACHRADTLVSRSKPLIYHMIVLSTSVFLLARGKSGPAVYDSVYSTHSGLSAAQTQLNAKSIQLDKNLMDLTH